LLALRLRDVKQNQIHFSWESAEGEKAFRFVDTFRKADTMSTPMADTPKRRRARRRFDEDFKAQAIRLVLDCRRRVGRN
jgi:hypothetical protein